MHHIDDHPGLRHVQRPAPSTYCNPSPPSTTHQLPQHFSLNGVYYLHRYTVVLTAVVCQVTSRGYRFHACFHPRLAPRLLFSFAFNLRRWRSSFSCDTMTTAPLVCRDKADLSPFGYHGGTVFQQQHSTYAIRTGPRRTTL